MELNITLQQMSTEQFNQYYREHMNTEMSDKEQEQMDAEMERRIMAKERGVTRDIIS